MNLHMTESEIVRSYKEAKYKPEQVVILAQLNLVEPKDIKDILKRHGEIVTKQPTSKKGLKPDHNKIEKYRRYAAEGFSKMEAAEKAGVSYNTIQSMSDKYGIVFTSGKRRNKKAAP